MSSGLKVAIVGATGAVEQDLIETLEAGMVEIAEWRLISDFFVPNFDACGRRGTANLALPVEAGRVRCLKISIWSFLRCPPA